MCRARLAILTLTIVVASAVTSAAQQRGSTGRLLDEIREQDRSVFDAFNAHDLDRVMRFFADDLEFFHDQDGLLSYGQVRDGFAALFAADNGLRRDLLPGTLRVFEIAGYGAMQLGTHRFCHEEDGREDCGEFEFVHVFQRTDRGWLITRVLSYGH